MTRPVCWSKSWRLTPRMKTRAPLTSRSSPRISTRRKPIRTVAASTTSPSGDRSVTWRSWRTGARRTRRRRPGSRGARRRGRRAAAPADGRAPASGSAASARTAAPAVWRDRVLDLAGQLGRSSGTCGAAAACDVRRPVERRLDRPAGRRLATREPDATVSSSVPVARSSAESGDRADVGEVDGAGRVQEDRTADPAVPPLVLVLDVGRVGPLHDARAERVRSRPEPVGQVELRGEVRVLADADRRRH